MNKLKIEDVTGFFARWEGSVDGGIGTLSILVQTNKHDAVSLNLSTRDDAVMRDMIAIARYFRKNEQRKRVFKEVPA